MSRPLGRALLVVCLLGAASACRSAAWDEVEGARAHRRVVTQVEAGPRVPGSAGHRRVREWIASELRRLGGTVTLQSFTDSSLAEPLEVHNVIGSWRPAKAPPSANGPLVLCAHYDTRPWADQDPDSSRRGEPIPGANDGGSGVAVLLEVAEVLSRRAPPCAVDLVFFDAEDQGRSGQPGEYSIGARGYAARLGDPRPRAAFLFDMVGDEDLAIHPEGHSMERASNLVGLVQSAARATGARSFRDTPGPYVMDDHVPLLEAGVPAVDVIDFEYPAWHTHQDLPDRVSPRSLAEVARVAVWLAYASPLARLR